MLSIGNDHAGNPSKRALRLSCAFFLLTTTLFSMPRAASAAEPIVLDDNLKTSVLGKELDILEDPTTKLTVEDVTLGPQASEFRVNEKAKPNFGFTKSAFWVRFSLQNNKDVPQDIILELDNAILDEIALFQMSESGGFSVQTLGDRHPFGNREIRNRNPVFKLHVPAKTTHTFHARLFTDGSMNIPLLLHKPDAFFAIDHNTQIAFGFYFGIVFVMGLYNLFLFFAVRDRTYIYYVVFIIGVSFFNMTISGLAYEYLLHSIPWRTFVDKSLLFFIALIGGPGCLFTISFLKTKEIFPRLHKLLVGLALSFAVLFVAIILGPYGPISLLCALMTVTWGFVLTGTGIYALAKGYRPARFYVLAWIALLTGCILQAARLLGLAPQMFLTMYGMEIGSALEVILLSLALADRITIMKQEKELAQREAIESYKKADKIKNDFLANTSHELRTPLNGIIGIAESLIDGAAGSMNKTAKENLRMIVGAGQRLSTLVNDILDFSKLRNRNLDLQLKPIALKQLVDVEIALLSPLIGTREVHLKNEVPENLIAVKADENRLIQILQNVIGNAIKFTKAGRIVITAEHKDKNVEIKVIDTGIGIPADKLEDIFIAFEQADGGTTREYGGTGIGLSITKKLVELHGGTIFAQSELGKGSIFVITLPATDENATEASVSNKLDYVARPMDLAAQDEEEAVERIPAASGRGIHILAVDDEPLNLKVLTNQLTLNGHRVSVGRDGEEALRFIEEHGKPDLMLLDVMMPKMTGLEVCQILREKYSATELPIILLTAKNQLTDLVSGFSVGANDYLTKPFSSREVLARIRVHSQVSEFSLALAQANEELRVQIAKRSEQLFSTLAILGQGTTEIRALERGKVIGERYEIKKRVGEGGMGIVYEAKVLATGKQAALKIAKSGDARALSQLAQEARMAVEVLHENVVRVFDVDVAPEGFLYVVMEYLEGKDLSDLRENWGNLEWGLKVLRQVCSGLHELHKHNLVHRDLKPTNLIVINGDSNRDFRVKITDFGISSWAVAQNLPRLSESPHAPFLSGDPALPAASDAPKPPPFGSPTRAGAASPAFPQAFALDGEDTAPPAHTLHGNQTGTLLSYDWAGTPRFMSPEQLQRGEQPGKATDIWAIGVIAHRILANQWPIEEESFADLLTGVGTPKPKPIGQVLPGLNSKIAAAIDRCLDYNPNLRPSAKELADLV
ncbi:MAG: ATP-binding protein [Myxococcota bacterium]|jgi:signal transduction histidine kinase/serine/threonine protein kinase/CheY-like chemotaxis protein|nr:ATP-binding protein [Myxococcota bacterium]